MALSRTTRVNILIGNGHFLSHFYVLCLPPMFLAWQDAFHVSFAELGMTIMLMSGTTALLQTPVGFLVDRHGARPFLIGGALLMSLSIAAMGLATVILADPGAGDAVRRRQLGHPPGRLRDPVRIGGQGPHGPVLRPAHVQRQPRVFRGPAGHRVADGADRLARRLADRRAAGRAGGAVHPAAKPHPEGPGARTRHGAVKLSGRELLTNRTMLLFFLFFMLGAMAGGGVQSWLVTVLHTVKGIDLEVAATALTAYMLGSTTGVLVGGWFADAFKQHVLPFVTGLTILSALLMVGIDWLHPAGVAIIGMTFLSGLALRRQPHAARRDAEGRRAAGPDRQGVRLRQRRPAAGQRDYPGAVRLPDRPRATRNWCWSWSR